MSNVIKSGTRIQVVSGEHAGKFGEVKHDAAGVAIVELYIGKRAVLRHDALERLDGGPDQERDDHGRFSGPGGGGGPGDPHTTGGGPKGQSFQGHGSHDADHAHDAPAPEKGSEGDHSHHIAATMRNSMQSLGHETSAIKSHGDGTHSFQHVQPAKMVDKKTGKVEFDQRKVDKRPDKYEKQPAMLVTRHFDQRGTMTVTAHKDKSTTNHDGHPSSIAAAGGVIHDAQPWKK